MHNQPSFLAGEDLAPSIFVKMEAGVDNTIVKCGAGDQAIGVTAEHSRTAPIPGATVLAAADGESTQIYGLGEPCEITAGAAITAGAYLKPNASGQAIPAVATDKYSAQARTSAASGEKVKAVLKSGVL